MHFNLKKAVGISVLPLLGGALAVGAAALPANAATWQDTALRASHVTQPSHITGAVVKGVFSNHGHKLTFTAPSGEFFAGRSFTVGSTGAMNPVSTRHSIVLTSAGGVAGTGGTLTFTIRQRGVACNAAQTVSFFTKNGVLGVSNTTSTPSEMVKVTVFNNNTNGAVYFTGTVSINGVVVKSCPVTFSQKNLPAGLTSGNPLPPGSAVPGFYRGVIYAATDPLGSTFPGRFDLRVLGHVVVPQGNYGDEVNPFGNGFDVFKQHQYPGAIIAGWTATKADPATHFIRNNGTHQGAYQYEYAPHGAAVGLCVSDPGGGWSSDPLPDGLILTPCNTGPWQQFIPQSNGTLKNVATGLIVSPNGTGAQLRGTAAPTSWGGSVYHWTDYAHLPG